MSSPAAQPLKVFASDDTLLRALRSSKQFENFAEAFFLRDEERDSGLSVFYDCDAEYCRNQFRKTYGVLSLIVQAVQELELDIVADDQPNHANIKGVPHKEDDPQKAEWLAGRLAECATLIDRGMKKGRA